MTEALAPAALARDTFLNWLRREGENRYHDPHPYHVLMHEGKLTKLQLQQWVLNRYYYQTRIPIKDAIIPSKSEDPAFRRMWIRRIHDHDGERDGEGGLALWLRLAEGVGLDREVVARCRSVLPDLMSKRIAVWERHYPWVSPEMLGYFRARVPRARRDSEEAVDFVVRHATTYELQERCVAALIRKTEILWHLLDCVYAAYIDPGWGPAGRRA